MQTNKNTPNGEIHTRSHGKQQNQNQKNKKVRWSKHAMVINGKVEGKEEIRRMQ